MVPREKQKSAVAVKYRPGLDNAPKVLAKGKGKIAEKIIEIAREHNIYTHSDSDLVEILCQLDLGEEIPAEVYVIVAELLTFVYFLNRGERLQ